MLSWWESLTLLERALACIAIPATLLLVIQFLMSLLGLGGHDADADTEQDFDTDADDFDGDVDADGDMDGDMDGDELGEGHELHDGSPGFSLNLFTFRGFTAFFAVCGWAALAISRAGHPWLAAILIGIALGAAAMLLVAVVMALFISLQSDGTVDIGNAVGRSGLVYLTIPAARSGSGKVNVVIQEKLTECEAVTDEQQPVSTGAEVTVVGVTRDRQLIVIKK